MSNADYDLQFDAELEERDHDWRDERQREVLRSMSVVERRTLFANYLSVIIIVGFAQLLANGDDFLLPGIARFLVILGSSLVYDRLRRKLAANDEISDFTNYLGAIGLVAGTSWALLLLPIFQTPSLHPAAFLVCAGIMISFSLVIANISSVLSLWVGYGVSFLTVFWIGTLSQATDFAITGAIGVTIVYLAVAIFSRGTSIQRIGAADLIIQNKRLGEHLSDALAEAEFLANRDPLTGLYNRRALFEDLVGKTAQGAMRHLLLVDIDNFKQVNDRFGHDTGDRILIRIAERMRDLAREHGEETNFAVRLGGEEFLMLVTLDSATQATWVAENLRSSIQGVAREFNLPDLLGTASIGVASFGSGETFGKALQRADAALYEAKQAGRNQVRRRDGTFANQ